MSCKPESETPETDAVYGQFINTVTPDVIDFHALLKAMDTCARSLERRLRLAQTEIKWYMRVEEELRAELDESRKNIGPAAYGKNQDGTYNICLGYHPEEDQYEWLVVIPAAEAQSRIAELEKDNKLWHANWEAAYAEKQAAEKALAEYSKPPRMIVQCKRHEGTPIIFKAYAQTAYGSYCPQCEDEAALKDRA